MEKITLKYRKIGQVRENTGAIITLIIGVGVSILVIIFIGALGGQIYAQTEPDIEAIGGEIINETVGTADANGYFSGYLSKTNIVEGSEIIYCGGEQVPSANYTLNYTSGYLEINYNTTACQNGQVLATYKYGDYVIASNIKNSIVSGFKSLKITGNYLPIIVMASFMFIALGLIFFIFRRSTPPQNSAL